MNQKNQSQTNLPEPAQHGAHEPSKIMKSFGLALFFIGLVVFTGSIFVGSYQINPQVLYGLSETIPNEDREKLCPLMGETYSSKFSFISAIEDALNDEGQIQPYQLGQYKIAILTHANHGLLKENPFAFFLSSILLATIGILIFSLAGRKSLPGIKNNHIFQESATSRGALGILAGIYLIGFYILLYWYPEYITNMIILVEPVSQFIRGLPADRWFLYGTLYTFAVAVMGVRMFVKYRHNRYHLVRTGSIIFFQFGFAFMLPAIMERLNQPSMDLKNSWPLNYSFFMDWNLNSLLSGGGFGLFLMLWGIFLAVFGVPLMTFFFGKRWYCSWVCGCGGLAETLGDPYRQLSDKSLKAWRFERISIHAVLVFAVVMTVMQISNFLSNGSIFASYTWRVNQWYSFLIGSAFAGVIGTGFYPLMGNRVWCRLGCPLAAILGIVQKFKSRFQITTNGGQCISCGNCSTYCEMGIDVRWYAQRGQNIIRASCVGCGVCSAVCPRGVLKLENGEPSKRYNVVLEDEVFN